MSQPSPEPRYTRPPKMGATTPQMSQRQVRVVGWSLIIALILVLSALVAMGFLLVIILTRHAFG